MRLDDKNLILRKASEEDCRFIWELANDPVVRAVSFSSEEIPWEVHKKWFNARSQDPECLLYVAENSLNEKVGQIRFELKDEGWVISISIVKAFRGKSLGGDIIKAGSQMLFDSDPEIDKIYAYIKQENSASIHVFKKAGYEHAGFATVKEENDAVLMVKNLI